MVLSHPGHSTTELSLHPRGTRDTERSLNKENCNGRLLQQDIEEIRVSIS